MPKSLKIINLIISLLVTLINIFVLWVLLTPGNDLGGTLGAIVLIPFLGIWQIFSLITLIKEFKNQSSALKFALNNGFLLLLFFGSFVLFSINCIAEIIHEGNDVRYYWFLWAVVSALLLLPYFLTIYIKIKQKQPEGVNNAGITRG